MPLLHPRAPFVHVKGRAATLAAPGIIPGQAENSFATVVVEDLLVSSQLAPS